MNNINQPTIGIVGGAGPMASCLLNQYDVEVCQKELGCKDDRDFPLIINYSYPFSAMLNAMEAQENRNQLSGELEFCLAELAELAELANGRRLVHWNRL